MITSAPTIRRAPLRIHHYTNTTIRRATLRIHHCTNHTIRRATLRTHHSPPLTNHPSRTTPNTLTALPTPTPNTPSPLRHPSYASSMTSATTASGRHTSTDPLPASAVITYPTFFVTAALPSLTSLQLNYLSMQKTNKPTSNSTNTSAGIKTNCPTPSTNSTILSNKASLKS